MSETLVTCLSYGKVLKPMKRQKLMFLTLSIPKVLNYLLVEWQLAECGELPIRQYFVPESTTEPYKLLLYLNLICNLLGPSKLHFLTGWFLELLHFPSVEWEIYDWVKGWSVESLELYHNLVNSFNLSTWISSLFSYVEFCFPHVQGTT